MLGIELNTVLPESEECGRTNAKDEDVPKRNPMDVFIRSPGTGKLVKIVNRERIVGVVRDVRTPSGSDTNIKQSKNGVYR